MRPILRPLSVALLGASLFACATDPVSRQASGIHTQASWSRLPADQANSDVPLASAGSVDVEHRWWRNFGDPTLDRLIQSALANNKMLQVAQGRVEEARAMRGGAEANLLPEVTGNADIMRGNQGYATNNKAIGFREANVQASWEIDLFGKNQAKVAEASAILQSEEAHRQAVMVTLLADVARSYFDLRNAEEQVAITQKNLKTQQNTLNLTNAQLAGALASDLDVERAAAQVSATSAQLPVLQSQYDVALDRLNVLLGYPPGTDDAWIKPPQTLRALNQNILIAAPAKVLANRPDVRAAERNFAASISASRAAAKEIYPTISLAALFGIQDSSAFTATPWNVGTTLAQPILNFGRIQSDIDVADARQRQAFSNYQETVLDALEDMENAISQYLHETRRQHDLGLAADQNRKSVKLATQQYTNGYTGLLDVLEAQRNELDAESNLASSNVQLRKNLVSIYAAAGGGWNL